MSPAELNRIARTAYAYGVASPNATAYSRAFAAGVEELAHYLASGYAEASDVLTEVVPDLRITD